jgi:hypothetical protein
MSDMKGSGLEILAHIAEEHPEGITQITEHPEIQPPVKEEYLLELCGDNEVLTELFEEMIHYFYRYTYDVCRQEGLKKNMDENLEKIREMEAPRSALHNAMIDSVRIFMRALKKEGKDTSWFDPIDKKSRAGYAQLALLTTYLDIIRNDHDHGKSEE